MTEGVERADLLAVTQTHRDAAASAIIDACDRTLDIRMGERDDNPVVQAFARAALSPPVSDGALREALEKIAGACYNWNPGSAFASTTLARVAAIARAALSPVSEGKS